LVQTTSSLSGLLAQSGFDLGPFFFPGIGADDVAYGKHGIDALFCPVHTRTFQARFHNQLIPTFHNAAANWLALGLKTWVLDLLSPFFQGGKIITDGLRIWMLLEGMEFTRKFIRAYMFQAVQTLVPLPTLQTNTIFSL
jgi:hypothetical protein